MEVFKQTIQIKPDLAGAHYNLGLAYVRSGMHREAIEAFKQAIRINPDFAEAHYSLGLAYVRSGMYREAIEVFKQVLSLWLVRKPTIILVLPMSGQVCIGKQ
jgi:pentatricopeptide repeat protein